MIEKTREVRVTNRGRGVVGYRIEELNNLRRQFQHGETKTLTFDELQHLSWIPGGMALLKNELVIHDEEVVQELLHGVEPEYYYGENEVRYLLTSAPIEQLLDCLDFAPEGVLNLIKSMAVSLPCNDVAKREAIYNKLGFSVTNAISLIKAVDEAEDEKPIAGRRAAPVNEEAAKPKPATTRRYVTNKK